MVSRVVRLADKLLGGLPPIPMALWDCRGVHAALLCCCVPLPPSAVSLRHADR